MTNFSGSVTNPLGWFTSDVGRRFRFQLTSLRWCRFQLTSVGASVDVQPTSVSSPVFLKPYRWIFGGDPYR